MKIAEYLKLTKQAENEGNEYYNGPVNRPISTSVDGLSKEQLDAVNLGVSLLRNQSGQTRGGFSNTTPTNIPSISQSNQVSSEGSYTQDDNRFYSLDEAEKRTRAAELDYNKPKGPIQIAQKQPEYSPVYKESYQPPKQLDTNALFMLPLGMNIKPSIQSIKERLKHFNDKNPFQWGVENGQNPFESTDGFIKEPFKMEPIQNPAEGRSWWKYFKDFGNRKAWGDWWNYVKQKHWDFNRYVKEQVNEPFRMVNAFRRPIKPIDFGAFHGLIGKAFPVLIPLDEATKTIEQNATDRAYLDGVNVGENRTWVDYAKYLPYYYSELLKEVGRSSPNMLTEAISFMNPVAPVTMTGEALAIPLRMAGYEGKVVPGFYHPHYEQNRIRSDADWENSWNPEYIHPDQIKQNSERYGNANYWIDNAAAYVDPIAQTAGWLVDKAYQYAPTGPIGMTRFVTGNPYFFGNKPTYEHIMDEVGNLMDKTTKYDIGPDGTKTVDYQDLINDSGWYDLNGGRPEFRNIPIEKRKEMIQPMIAKAIKNGWTKKDIDKAVKRYIVSPGDPDTEGGSLLYSDANLLPIMAMSPSEVYGSMEFQNKVTNPEDISGIPRYIRKYVPGYMASGTFYNEENPKWLEAKKSLERRIADQKTLFREEPFFAALHGRDNQLSEEEEAFLNNEKNLAWLESLEDADIPKLKKVSQEDFNGIPADLRKQFEIANIWRQISKLPLKQRYAVLYWNPKLAEQFIDRYYTNEETKSRLRKFLGVPEPKTTYPEVESAATQMSLILPILQKARQRAEEIQRRNSGM